MRELYPLQLCGVTKSPIWGGTRLLRDWNKTSAASTVGESWELTVRTQEKCVVTNGTLGGKTLDEVIKAYGTAVTGGGFGAGDFPLLIKLIDAEDDLSVQVHPDDAYAARVENDRGKTEMWYIVDAAPGAELICGLADGVSREDYANAVKAGDVMSALKRQPVRVGETYFIPAGLPHAIGKGILIAEIQQNCDRTYRVYDYDRRQPDGSLRELHVEKALDVIRPFTDAEIDAIRYSKVNGVYDRKRLLAHCDFFRVEKLTLSADAEPISDGSMRHILCLSGKAQLAYHGETYTVTRGDSWLLPASLTNVTATGDATLLLSSVG
ncbi:MAG: class I mannose-6-phosphate isomerase [Clostridia bacterium]|nr:class I mannose-6-phosphate isomerase [Clostridia bacterium]